MVLCADPSTAVETTCNLVTQPGDCDDEDAEVAPAEGEDPTTIDCTVPEEEEALGADDLPEDMRRVSL